MTVTINEVFNFTFTVLGIVLIPALAAWIRLEIKIAKLESESKSHANEYGAIKEDLREMKSDIKTLLTKKD